MKTKNLMTAVALSAMFAACSQDAELNETIAKNDFSNVPMVEADFTVNTGVDSRMATKYGWELDDIVGFVWGGAEDDGKAYANNPLYCTDVANTKFEGQSMYYVGEYFAYIPYADALKGVDYVPFSIKGQKLSTSLADYAKHNIMISPSQTELVVLGEDEELEDGQQEAGRKKNYPLYLSQLSNTAKIVLNFENAEALTDLKVTKVTLDLIGGNEEESILPLNFDFEATGYGNVTVKEWNEITPAGFYTKFVAEDTRENGALTLKSEEGLSVTGSTLTTYAVVLPHRATTINQLNITVETNYGKIVANDVKVIAKGKTESDAAAVSSTTELFAKFGVTGTVVAKLNADEMTVDDKTVKDQTELEEVLRMLVTSGYENEVAITVKPTAKNADKTFVLTDFTLPEGLKAPIKLTADATNAGNGFVFAGSTTIDKPLWVVSNAKITGTMTVKYVKDKVTFTSEALTTISNESALINEGKIMGNFKTAAATTGTNAKVAGKYVSNGEHAGLVTGYFKNDGEAEWIAGTNPAANTTFEGNPVYAYAASYKRMAEIAAANVAYVKLSDVNMYNNNADITVSGIVTIECIGDVKFGISSNANNATGNVNINFPDLTYIVVAEDATLSIYPASWSGEKPEFTFGWSSQSMEMTNCGNLLISDLTVTGADATIYNGGYVSLYRVEGSTTFSESVISGTDHTWSTVN